jgi:hypothetical protein
VTVQEERRALGGQCLVSQPTGLLGRDEGGVWSEELGGGSSLFFVQTLESRTLKLGDFPSSVMSLTWSRVAYRVALLSLMLLNSLRTAQQDRLFLLTLGLLLPVLSLVLICA